MPQLRSFPRNGARLLIAALALTACDSETSSSESVRPPPDFPEAGLVDVSRTDHDAALPQDAYAAGDSAPGRDAGPETEDAQPEALDSAIRADADIGQGTGDASVLDAAMRDTSEHDTSEHDADGPDANEQDARGQDVEARDASGVDASGVDADGSRDGAVGDSGAPTVLNPNWIGGPCSTASDCSYPDAICLAANDGYWMGTCSQSCTQFCPDREGPSNSGTFCIHPQSGSGQGTCLSRCDYTLSPTGCRAGYVCLPEKRMNQPTMVRHVCVPESGIPGRPEPIFDIGASCQAPSDCQRNTCLTGLAGGYCTQEQCQITGCPTGSECWRLGQENNHACIKTCTTSSECRTGEGYTCDADGTCWYSPTRPSCVLNDAAGDCVDHASSAASSDYVVVTKHLRRLTLCRGPRFVGAYCVGLGFAPQGDKERQGDGKTPEGIFYIPRKLPNSQYYKAFLISYPDTADAMRGLASGLITRAEYDAIVRAQNQRTEPPQDTNLGGLIEIHGMGSASDWTAGCIAGENTSIDVLWPVLDVGETVIILP